MDEFRAGTIISAKIGGDIQILHKLGEGGQGIVYLAKYNGKNYALKWYFQKRLKNPDRFYQNLESNIKLGSPTSAFLWPLIITEKCQDSFGYLMELRPKEYEDFSKFLLAKVRFASISAVISAALNIVNGFRQLHRAGFSYQDLNDGNFFINPQNGDVLICDNDNVAQYGENLGIAGKCRYMAPEVVLGEKLPSVHTDRFSLAVTLFLLLFISHPLEGQKTMCPCLTEELEKRFFGKEPVFIYDPTDYTNKPVRGIHNNAIKLWPLYPRFIQEAFELSFGKGLKNESDRISETIWQKLFVKMRDCLIVCNCGSETFLDINAQTSKCIVCGKNINKPLLLKVKSHIVALYPKTKIYLCHTDINSDDYKEISGEIIQSKSNPGLWGLKNLSSNTWYITTPDGNQKSINNGEVTPILRGIKINFSMNEAEIV